MAEQTKDAAWWEGQWNQLKQELDVLNPKHDAAQARIRELEAANALLAKEKAEAEKARDAATMHGVDLGNQIEALKADLTTANGKLVRMVEEFNGSQQAVQAQKARADKLLAALNAANAAFAPAARVITEALHGSI